MDCNEVSLEKSYPYITISVTSIERGNKPYSSLIEVNFNKGMFYGLIHEKLIGLIKEGKNYCFWYEIPNNSSDYIKIIHFRVVGSSRL